MRSLARTIFPALALAGASLAAAGERCPAGNLVEGAAFDAREVSGDPRTIGDGLLAREGWPSDSPQAARLAGRAASVSFDLGAARPIRALLVQADPDDVYEVAASVDGWSWQPLWQAPVAGASGLRTRRFELPAPVSARYLRIAGSGGDGRYAVSELRAYCRVPPEFRTGQPPFYAPSKRPWLTRKTVPWIQAAVAMAGLFLFLWGWVLRRAGRPDADAVLRDRLLAALGILAAASWFNFGKFNFDAYVHLWDQLHYYLGSKYASELAHDGLYECIAVADVESGLGAQVLERKIRNLRTNELEWGEVVLADPQRCTRRFSGERWAAFKADVAWFRGRMPAEHWSILGRDHGYNASPMWEALGTRLSNLTRAGDGALLGLALLDVAWLCGMWVAVTWAFGWRATCVALLWWGTNNVAEFTWNGGGFLRYDWLALAVGGICLVKRGFPAAGGAALTWATLLRIFPGFIVAALVLKAVVEIWRGRTLRLLPAHRRFAAGCLVALAILLPLSFTSRGPRAWSEFARNSARHLAAPGTNAIGLVVPLAWEPSTRVELLRNPTLPDPDGEWKAARQRVRGERAWIRLSLLLAYVALLAAAVARQEDWAALVLGIGLIPFATVQSCYYFAVLLAYGALWLVRRESMGVALCALSVWTHAAQALWPENVRYDQRFMWISLGVLLFVVWATALALTPAAPSVDRQRAPGS